MKKCVAWLLVNDIGEILLQKRTPNYNRYPNKWTLFGGGIKKDECAEDAVKREIKEELGLEIETEFMCVEINEEKEIYLFKDKLNDLSQIKLMEGNGFAFFSIDEIKELDSPNVELILKLQDKLK